MGFRPTPTGLSSLFHLNFLSKIADARQEEVVRAFPGKVADRRGDRAGQAQRPGEDEEISGEYPVTFDGDQMEMIYEGNKTIKWTVTIRPDITPAEIDAALPKDVMNGKVVRGIYKFKEGTLTIALGVDEDSTRPTKFQ
jgi:uncharacterized protein (TIGR03067 family)